MKKFISACIVMTILFSSIFIVCSRVNATEIQPRAVQYRIYQYITGSSYKTPTFHRSNMGADYLANGSVSGSDVYVSVYDVDTNKKIGSTQTMYDGRITVCPWDDKLAEGVQNIYYLFVPKNQSAVVFLNLYVLY